MKNLLVIISFLFFSCQEKSTKNDKLPQSIIKVEVENLEKETVGFQDKYDSLPKLEMSTIDENMFNQFVNSQNIKVSKLNEEIKTDTIQISISEDYELIIKKSVNESEKSQFFEPIIEDLEKEKTLAQIIYDKKNIIINLEIGNNGTIYEDFYLSKHNPITIEKVVRTTINKTNPIQKTVCEKILNKPIFSSSRYEKLDNSDMKCYNSIQN
jgi:hypothetical protein